MHFTVANLDHHIASMDSNVGDEFKGAQTSAEQSSLYFVLQTGKNASEILKPTV